MSAECSVEAQRMEVALQDKEQSDYESNLPFCVMVPSSSRSRTRGFQPLNREFEPPWDHHYERKAQLDNMVATYIIKIIRMRRLRINNNWDIRFRMYI